MVGPPVSASGADGPLLVAAKNVNLAVAFALELAVLVAVGLWAYRLPAVHGRMALRIAAAAAAVVVMTGIWAVFGAPDAAVALHGVVKFAFLMLWFGAGALAFAATCGVVVGAIFYAVYLVSLVLAGIWHQ